MKREFELHSGMSSDAPLPHTDRIAGLVLSAGLAARVWSASGTFLNPDEAQHFLVANRESLSVAYKSSLTLAHPPLLILVLYFWRHLGNSEMVLRASSIVAGVLFCWIFFKWLTLILGRNTALVGLIFVSLLPPLISLSAQVRQYSLLLLFVALAAYLFEKSLLRDSAKLMLLFSISLYLAMLSHYSALFFLASIGAYAVARQVEHWPSRRVVATWLLGQTGALALLIFLYRTHISKLKGSSLSQQAIEGWLRRSYFHPGQDHILPFALGRTFGIFQFAFGNLAIGDVMGVLFILGMAMLFKSKMASRNWELGSLLLLPFVLNCLAALKGAYPYGGTRHSVFLVVFGIASISLVLTVLTRGRTVRSLAAALTIVAACAAFQMPHQPYMTRADQSLAQMNSSLAFIHQQIPRSTPIFIDVQTRMLLGFYLCRDQQTSAEAPQGDFEVLQCGGYRLLVANLWMFDSDSFPHWWEEMIRTYGLKPAETVWIAQEGWGVGIGPTLTQAKSEPRAGEINSFGRNIQLFKLMVGQPQASSGLTREPSFHPATPVRPPS